MKTILNSMPPKLFTVPGYARNKQYIPRNVFFNKLFQGYPNKVLNSNKLINALINQVMVGTYPHTTIPYPNVLISKDFLPAAENANVAIKKDGSILFTWSDNSGTKTAKTNDKVILVTYFPAIKKLVYTLHAATRGSFQALLQINKMGGYAIETWIGFVSHDERDSGDSVYAVKVNL